MNIEQFVSSLLTVKPEEEAALVEALKALPADELAVVMETMSNANQLIETIYSTEV